MREILFRGKTDDGEWVYGSFCMDAREQFNGLCGVDGFIRLYDKAKGKMQTYEVDRETVGQYTGLLDKHGKRIFEGDIVDYISSDVIGNPKTGTIIVEDMTDYDTMIYLNHSDELQIIGNIHDNPELLKGGGDNG